MAATNSDPVAAVVHNATASVWLSSVHLRPRKVAVATPIRRNAERIVRPKGADVRGQSLRAIKTMPPRSDLNIALNAQFRTARRCKSATSCSRKRLMLARNALDDAPAI